MKVIDQGHTYLLEKLEDQDYGIGIRFIKKEEKDGELVTVQDGTTNEEVLEMLIDRLQYLNDKLPCVENMLAIGSLKNALRALEIRSEKREKQEVEGTNQPHK